MADSPLQKAPTGLLGAFDLKTQGLNPSRFSDGVGGVYSVLPFYLLDATRVGDAQDNVQLRGDGVSLQVPEGECWRVLSVTAELICFAAEAAPDGILLSISASMIGSSTHGGLATLNLAALAAPLANGATFRLAWSGDLIIGPGGELATSIGAELSQAEVLRILVQYQPFPS